MKELKREINPQIQERERLIKIFSDAFIGVEPLHAAFADGLKAVYEAGQKNKLDEPVNPEPKFKGG